MEKKNILFFGFALFMICAVSVFFYSQQVTAQQSTAVDKPAIKEPAKEAAPAKAPAKTKASKKAQAPPKEFAEIFLTGKGYTTKDGTVSEVKVFTSESEFREFANKYPGSAPVVLKVKMSPLRTYYILGCRPSGGGTICW